MNFEPGTLNLPSWWLEAVLIWLALLGVILWFLGVKLVRPVLGLVGLAAGAVLASAFVQARFPDAIVWPWMIAGAAMFGVTGWIMWRLLVAVMLGGTVALLMLTAVMLWSDIPSPPPPDWDAVRERSAAADDEGEEGESKEPSVRAFIEDVAANVGEAWRGWWSSLESTHQWLLMGGALGAGTLALLVGLALPRLSAALITALLGVLFVTPGLHRWLPMLGQEVMAWTPQNGRQYLLVVIAATVIGAFVQWAFFRKSADK